MFLHVLHRTLHPGQKKQLLVICKKINIQDQKKQFRIILNDIANNNGTEQQQQKIMEAKEKKSDRSLLLVEERQTL